MKRPPIISIFLLVLSSAVFAQQSGNQVYNSQPKAVHVNSGSLDSGNENQYSIEASVLLNIKADSYVAVFGIQEENKTPEENNTKLGELVDHFSRDLSKLGVAKTDLFVDFITQNRVYDFSISGNTATEVLTGFETKKTVSVKFEKEELFEKIIAAAAGLKIFDLIKVDYVVNDSGRYRSLLFDEAVKIIKQKESRYRTALGVKLLPAGLAREKYESYFPARQYKRYQAYESGNARTNVRTGNQILLRKSSTFYYEPLDPNQFDKSINDIGIEPLVQFTVYLRMDYDTERIKTKDDDK